MVSGNWNEILGWGKDQIEDLTFIGYTYAREGMYDIALNIFKSLTILDAGNLYHWLAVGAIHLQQGQNIEALNALENALKIDPDDAEARLNRVKALYQLGYKDIATEEAKRLMRFPKADIANMAQALLMCYA